MKRPDPMDDDEAAPKRRRTFSALLGEAHPNSILGRARATGDTETLDKIARGYAAMQGDQAAMDQWARELLRGGRRKAQPEDFRFLPDEPKEDE